MAPPAPQAFGQLEIDLGFFPLMWMLFLVTPSVSINGFVERRAWGKHVWTLPAGGYALEAWYPWMFWSRSSAGRCMVNVFPGQVTRVKYRPSWLRFLPGSMHCTNLHELPQLAAPMAPPMLPPA